MTNERGQTPSDLKGAFAAMEQLAEQHAPGVLEIIDAYQALPQDSTWQPVNLASISYATGVAGAELR